MSLGTSTLAVRGLALPTVLEVTTASVIPFRRRRKGKNMVHEGKYAQAQVIPFELFEPLGVDFVAPTFATGDVQISKDGGAFANTANLPVAVGSTLNLTLTAAEKTAARLTVLLVDQTGTKVWLDDSITLVTYGHASAEHAFDRDAALTPALITTDMDANSANLDTIISYQLVIDGRMTGTRAEPGQGTPASTVDMLTKIDYIYKNLINKKDTDGTVENVYNSAGTVVDHKRTVSESAGTVTKANLVTGP